MMNSKIGIIGAGPAGIFCALQLLRRGVDGANIVIFESGPDPSKRKEKYFATCNNINGGKCLRCKTCLVMQGFGGAGGFSDGKLNYSATIGGNLGKFRNDTAYYFDEFDSILKSIRTSNSSIEKYFTDEKKYKNEYGYITHLGSDGCLELINVLYQFLLNRGVNIFCDTKVTRVFEKMPEMGIFCKTTNKEIYKFDKLICAIGRVGNAEIRSIFIDESNDPFVPGLIFNINPTPDSVDIGIRVETPNWVVEHLTKDQYEFKLSTEVKGLNVRTFCVNPGGTVINEQIDGAVFVNGYSNKFNKSVFTNFAVLANIRASETDDLNGYAKNISKLCNNMNIDGGVIAQKLTDFMIDRKTKYINVLNDYEIIQTTGGSWNEIAVDTEKLFYTAGNLNFILPSRIAEAIKEALRVFASKHIPDLFSNATVYGIEAKLYSDKTNITENFDIIGTCKQLYFVGDGSGHTRGFVQAAVSGMVAADNIVKNNI